MRTPGSNGIWWFEGLWCVQDAADLAAELHPPTPLYSSSLHIPCLCLRKSSLIALSCPLVKFPGDVAFLTLADADVQLVRAQLQGHPLPRAEVNSIAALGIILLFPLKCLMLISTFPWPAGMSHQPPGTKICIVSRCKSPFRSPKCWKEKGTVVRLLRSCSSWVLLAEGADQVRAECCVLG